MNFDKYKPVFEKDCKLSSKEQGELLDQMRMEFLCASDLLDREDADVLLANTFNEYGYLGPKGMYGVLVSLAKGYC